MDILDKAFRTQSCNPKLTPAICVAVSLARQTLNRYYSLTDSSDVYCIAMVLHPRHKLAYFKKAHWEPQWIQTAESLVHDEFECSYASWADLAADEQVLGSDMENSDIEVPRELAASNKPSFSLFNNIDAFIPPEAADLHSEIDRYLVDDVEQADDPVKWWHDHRAVYPVLSRMALDFLTIPPTSVDVEQLFSCGHLLLSHVWSHLSVNSTCALLCLGAWSTLGLVKTEDVKKVSVLPEVEGEEDKFEGGWAMLQHALD